MKKSFKILPFIALGMTCFCGIKGRAFDLSKCGVICKEGTVTYYPAQPVTQSCETYINFDKEFKHDQMFLYGHLFRENQECIRQLREKYSKRSNFNFLSYIYECLDLIKKEDFKYQRQILFCFLGVIEVDDTHLLLGVPLIKDFLKKSKSFVNIQIRGRLQKLDEETECEKHLPNLLSIYRKYFKKYKFTDEGLYFWKLEEDPFAWAHEEHRRLQDESDINWESGEYRLGPNELEIGGYYRL